MIEASAPAKIILFGEHAVVHGQPAIAIPFSALRARVTVAGEAAATELRSGSGDLLAALHAPHAGDPRLLQMLRVILQRLDAPAPARIFRLTSDIPPASGLGSGAAVSTALTRAIAQCAGLSVGAEQLNGVVLETEKLFHGTPSGIDNTVVVYERALCFTRGGRPLPVQVSRALQLLVADSGERCATHVPVSAVRELLRRRPRQTGECIEAIGRISRRALATLAGERPAEIGSLMYENHEQLRALEVSSPQLDRLVRIARGAGAAGAKLSGAGRGGNVIALVDESSRAGVARALTQAGASRIWRTEIPATRVARPDSQGRE